MKKILLAILVLFCIQWWFKDPTIRVPTNDISFSYIVKYSGEQGRSDYIPMLVALHGDGDTTKNFYNTALLDQFHVPVRIVLLEGPLSYSRGNAWPWTATSFNKYGRAINEAIELLAIKYPTAGKPILLGFSGGGAMAYYQAAKYGNRYSYVIPVSGRLSKSLLNDEMAKLGTKVLAFHGKNDRVVSFASGKSAADILQKRGALVEFTEFEGGHHGIFTNMKPTIMQVVEEKIKSLT